MSTGARKAAAAVGTALALMVAAYALALLVVPAMRPPFLRGENPPFPAAVLAHFGASAVALALGPLQFNVKFRARRIAPHRWMGRIYLAAVAVGGVSGFILATVSQGGMWAHAGFGLLALVWLATAAVGYRRIRRGDQVEHRRWMVRNYSLTFAAVTLRVYLPLAAAAFAIPFEVAYPVIAWLCWVPNLMVAEWWILK